MEIKSVEDIADIVVEVMLTFFGKAEKEKHSTYPLDSQTAAGMAFIVGGVLARRLDEAKENEH